MENRYLKEKYNRVRTWSRLKLGIQQLNHYTKTIFEYFCLIDFRKFPYYKEVNQCNACTDRSCRVFISSF